MKKLSLKEIRPNGSLFMPDILGKAKIVEGAIHFFKPGETAHTEAVHKHDVDEIFIFLQGKGVIPIDGVDYPVVAGDVFLVEAGEDHHTRSSVEEPLVAAWYKMDKSR